MCGKPRLQDTVSIMSRRVNRSRRCGRCLQFDLLSIPNTAKSVQEDLCPNHGGGPVPAASKTQVWAARELIS